MNKALEAFEELKAFLNDIQTGTCNSNAMRFTDSFAYLEQNALLPIETALKDYEMQKRIIKDLTASKNDLINERTKRIIERRAIYEDYNFQFLKRDVACKGCQYYKDEKCTNKDDCFWLDLEKKLTDYEKKSKVLEIIKEKDIDISYFMNCKTLKEYNDDVLGSYGFEETDAEWKMLIQEEFDLLKEELK